MWDQFLKFYLIRRLISGGTNLNTIWMVFAVVFLIQCDSMGKTRRIFPISYFLICIAFSSSLPASLKIKGKSPSSMQTTGNCSSNPLGSKLVTRRFFTTDFNQWHLHVSAAQRTNIFCLGSGRLLRPWFFSSLPSFGVRITNSMQ